MVEEDDYIDELDFEEKMPTKYPSKNSVNPITPPINIQKIKAVDSGFNH
jgi:hypothetical protein